MCNDNTMKSEENRLKMKSLCTSINKIIKKSNQATFSITYNFQFSNSHNCNNILVTFYSCWWVCKNAWHRTWFSLCNYKEETAIPNVRKRFSFTYDEKTSTMVSSHLHPWYKRVFARALCSFWDHLWGWDPYHLLWTF